MEVPDVSLVLALAMVSLCAVALVPFFLAHIAVKLDCPVLACFMTRD
jgi:hypothetical protein